MKTQFCRTCGKKITSADVFCKFCGESQNVPTQTENKSAQTEEKPKSVWGSMSGTNTTPAKTGLQKPTEYTTKFCQHCGGKIRTEAEICPNCGIRVPGTTQNVKKNSGIAALLSFLIVGAGQIYNGQIGKGLGFLIGMIFLTAFMFGLGSVSSNSAAFIFVAFLPLLLLAAWVFNIYDAYDTANKINAGEIAC